MSKNQKASGITNIINYDNSGNISFVSGSTTLMSVSSSGAVLLTGTMSGGTADSASYAYTASSATNAFNSISASYAYTASSAINAFSASYAISSSYAATASFSNDFTVLGNLTVFGTQSVQYITSSQLNVSDNVITVNVASPGVRFGGLSVFDSGSLSSEATASLFWDSQNNHWIYQRESSSIYNGGMLISGPRNFAGLGNEEGTTNNSLMKGQGGDHITSSAIFEVSGSVTMGTALTNSHSITGSVNITGSQNIYGNVGVGVTTTYARLNVNGKAQFGSPNKQTSGQDYIVVGQNSATGPDDATSAGIFVTHAAPTGSSNIALTYQFRQNDDSGGNLYGNMIAAYKVSGSNASYTVFNTNSTIGAGTEKMRITNDGLVGIGTNYPNLTLHINKSTVSGAPATSGITPTGYAIIGSGFNNNLYMGSYSVSPYGFWMQSQDASSLATNYPIILNPNGGNIGIGTTNPNSVLHVKDGSAGSITKPSGTRMIVESNGHTRINVQSPDTYSPSIDFSSPTYQNNSSITSYCAAPGTADIQFSFQGTPIMTLKSGSVFINTTSAGPIADASPVVKLVVNGDQHFSRSGAKIYFGDVSNSAPLSIGEGDQNQSGTDTDNMYIYCRQKLVIVPGGSYTMRVGIGMTNPAYFLELASDSAAKPSTNTWTISSDSRVKENIKSYTKGLNTLMQINPITYDYNGKAGFTKGYGGIGIIAQDVLSILPESISTYHKKLEDTDENETELYNFNSHALTYIMINAIQELKAENDSLKSRVEVLETK